MANTAAITQQISAVATLLACFSLTANGALSAQALFAADIALLTAGTLLYAYVAPRKPRLLLTVKRLCLFLLLLRVVAPVLRTLTLSVADDSIQALAIALSAVHLVAHDYAHANAISAQLLAQGAVSLNAAMFATVLLASRLATNELVSSTCIIPACRCNPQCWCSFHGVCMLIQFTGICAQSDMRNC
jgi:Phosphatidylinositol N-acetylglucosaminyltransferase